MKVKIKIVTFIFLFLFIFSLNNLRSSELNLETKFIPLKDFIVLKTDLFLSKNINNILALGGISYVAYEKIDYKIKINKSNNLNITMNAIMDKQRYTSKKYYPKLSDCNQVRNKIFVNKLGYSFFKRQLNYSVNPGNISNTVKDNILNISSLDEGMKDNIINNFDIRINVIHPKTEKSKSCAGKLNDLELK